MEQKYNRPVLAAAFTLILAAIILIAVLSSDKTTKGKTSGTPTSEISKPSRTGPGGATKGERPESPTTWERALANEDSGPQMTVSLDEVGIRSADGSYEFVSLVPPATRKTLAARISELGSPDEVFPLAYPEGVDKNMHTRRVITNEIRVKLPRSAAQSIAKEYGLKIKEVPDYTEEWVIYSADKPLDALAIIDSVRGDRLVAKADVLLGGKMTQKGLRRHQHAPNDPKFSRQWHLMGITQSPMADVNILAVWPKWRQAASTGLTGKGIRIGIIDDGLLTSHEDLRRNADTEDDYDWVGRDFDPTPDDLELDTHGTNCAGVAAARGNNGIGITGAAPYATLVGMRLLGSGTTDRDEAAAMAYKPKLPIHIKSNSWGPSDDPASGAAFTKPGPLFSAALKNSVTRGRNGRGEIFVWAGGNGGGNDNSNYDGYANSIYTIAVGASSSKAIRSGYSERGANLIVVAPSDGGTGDRGITTTDTWGLFYNDPRLKYYTDFGGTSSAAPLVSGIVALMLEQNPKLGWRDVQEILMKSAAKIGKPDKYWIRNGGGFHFNHQYGAGRVDAFRAVQLSKTWTNLGKHVSRSQRKFGRRTIPNNDNRGTVTKFNFQGSNMRVEHVTVRLDIKHVDRSDLWITLFSPSGTVSVLASPHKGSFADIRDYTFSTVRNWGEQSNGIWTLKVSDRRNRSRADGTLISPKVTIFGTKL